MITLTHKRDQSGTVGLIPARIEEAAAHPLGHEDPALKLCRVGFFGHRATRRSLHVDQTGTLSLTSVEPKRRSCWRLSQAA